MEMRYTSKTYDPTAELLAYATAGAAAVDLRVLECVHVAPGQVVAARTGVCIELPPNTAALILPRSGLGSKGLVLANTVGLIDEDYRGELTLMLFNRNKSGRTIHVAEGERAAQMVVIPVIRPKLVRVASLSETARGTGGFGSTGTK